MPDGTAPGAGPKPAVKSVIPRFVLAWVMIPVFLLATAGTLCWWEAWAYCGIILIPMTVFVAAMARKDPDFLQRRLNLKEKEKTQRRIISLASPLVAAFFVMPGLGQRFGWPEPPLPAVIAAEILVLLSYLAILRVFLLNRWAGRTIETVPGQAVISTGPYALVRHPMYTATLVFYLATPVALGSWWALIPAALCVPVFIARIKNEEEVLLRELPGYAEYRSNVRFRLVPRIW